MTVLLSGTPYQVRRLVPVEAAAFHALRLEGFSRHPSEFRIAVEDEADQPLERVAARLEREWVVGGFAGERLEGIGGLSRFDGAKLRHKALLWGMYVSERARGSGLADAIVDVLLSQARVLGVEQVLLTVAAENGRARRLYERWGFESYGVEPGAIKVGDRYLDETLMRCRSGW